MLNKSSKNKEENIMKIAFLLYEGMTALDLIGPYEILSRLPSANNFRVAKSAGPILTDSHITLIADSSLADITQADLLVIPGAGRATTLQTEPVILEWISRIHKTTQYTASICTGSLILGAAGLLSGIHATTHWAAFDRLSLWGAIPTKRRVVIDGKIVTASGVSAGIDMALSLGGMIAGNGFAQALQLAIEYDPDPPFDVGSPDKADPNIREAVRARMIQKFETL